MNELITFETFENSEYVMATKKHPFAEEKVAGILLFYQNEPMDGIKYYVASLHGYSKTNCYFQVDLYDIIEPIKGDKIHFNKMKPLFNNKECKWTPKF